MPSPRMNCLTGQGIERELPACHICQLVLNGDNFAEPLRDFSFMVRIVVVMSAVVLITYGSLKKANEGNFDDMLRKTRQEIEKKCAS